MIAYLRRLKRFIRDVGVLAMATKDLRKRVIALEKAVDQIGAMADIEWSEKEQRWYRFGEVEKHESGETLSDH